MSVRDRPDLLLNHSIFDYCRPRNDPLRQFSVVDRSARAPMKNAASCEKQCELQNTLIIGILNAHGGLGPRGLNLVCSSVVNNNALIVLAVCLDIS